jgi:hypothetical protein
MVQHHRRRREPGWHRGLAINAVGALATFLVLIDVLVGKFLTGAWIPVVMIPLLVVGFRAIRRHYRSFEAEVRVPDGWHAPPVHHRAVVVIVGVNRGALEAVAYTQALVPDRLDVVAVPVDDQHRADLEHEWQRADPGLPLRLLDSPYRHFVDPILTFLDEVDADGADAMITVVLPEVTAEHVWESPLHNQAVLLLAGELRLRPRTAVVTYGFSPHD